MIMVIVQEVSGSIGDKTTTDFPGEDGCQDQVTQEGNREFDPLGQEQVGMTC